MNDLESDLTRLAQPTVPEALAASITARIARLDDPRAADLIEASSDRSAWGVVALVGMTVGIGAQVYRLYTGEATLDFTSLRIGGGFDGVVEMLPASPAVAVLAAGLLLYLAGLFAPHRRTGYPR